jgi:hypothetical protein
LPIGLDQLVVTQYAQVLADYRPPSTGRRHQFGHGERTHTQRPNDLRSERLAKHDTDIIHQGRGVVAQQVCPGSPNPRRVQRSLAWRLGLHEYSPHAAEFICTSGM